MTGLLLSVASVFLFFAAPVAFIARAAGAAAGIDV